MVIFSGDIWVSWPISLEDNYLQTVDANKTPRGSISPGVNIEVHPTSLAPLQVVGAIPVDWTWITLFSLHVYRWNEQSDGFQSDWGNVTAVRVLGHSLCCLTGWSGCQPSQSQAEHTDGKWKCGRSQTAIMCPTALRHDYFPFQHFTSWCRCVVPALHLKKKLLEWFSLFIPNTFLFSSFCQIDFSFISPEDFDLRLSCWVFLWSQTWPLCFRVRLGFASADRALWARLLVTDGDS